MAAVAFDTLKRARALRTDAQMSAEQSEAVANALAEAVSGAELATKADIAAVKADLLATEHRLETKIHELRSDLLKTIMGTVAINTTVVIGAMFGLAKLLGRGPTSAVASALAEIGQGRSTAANRARGYSRIAPFLALETLKNNRIRSVTPRDGA
jgi:hypothetical protein